MIDHAAIIYQACVDATGHAPSIHEILSHNDKWNRRLRWSSEGKKHGTDCALKVIDKGSYYAYIIKAHRTGEVITGSTWQKSVKPKSEAEKRRERQQLEQRKREFAAKLARRKRMLSGMAKRLWVSAIKPADWEKPHRYLISKGNLSAPNIRRYTSRKRDVLLLPMACPFDGLQSLYLIYPNGFKRPLKGTQFNGLCMAIGHNLDKASTLWLCEGYATGVSLYQQVNQPVVVAFSASNLKPVADKLIRKYQNADINLCADDDRKTAVKIGRNPGIEHALKVQQAHPQIALYKPLFPADAPDSLSDVNDVANYQAGLV